MGGRGIGRQKQLEPTGSGVEWGQSLESWEVGGGGCGAGGRGQGADRSCVTPGSCLEQ